MFIEITNPTVVNGEMAESGQVLEVPCEVARELYQRNHCVEAKNLPEELSEADDNTAVETTEDPAQISLRNRKRR